MLLGDQFQYGDKCGACAMKAQVHSVYKSVMDKPDGQRICVISVHLHYLSSFIQYSVWRQVQSLLQNDAST